jgi:hypothetical protein
MCALHLSTSSAAIRRRRASVVRGARGFATREKWCGCVYGDGSGGGVDWTRRPPWRGARTNVAETLGVVVLGFVPLLLNFEDEIK